MSTGVYDMAELAAFDPEIAKMLVLFQAQWDFALTLADPVDRAIAMDGIQEGYELDPYWEDWRRFRDARLAALLPAAQKERGLIAQASADFAD